jgi:hypothetical protein
MMFVSIWIENKEYLTFFHFCFKSGKIAVIGGCREYTGAPYFAAISALKIVSTCNLSFYSFIQSFLE